MFDVQPSLEGFDSAVIWYFLKLFLWVSHWIIGLISYPRLMFE